MVNKFSSMALILIIWHHKYLTDPLSSFQCCDFEYKFWQYSNESIFDFCGLLLFLENNIVFPFIVFLIYKWDTINIEQEQNLEFVSVFNELFISSLIFVYTELGF